jgi:protocatechuate 3,4-dioxygenase beta subunit
VLDHQGRPFSKVAVMAYNTDVDGRYAPQGSTSRVPRIRGATVTDEQGRYRFSTIWPGTYPDGSEPAHIHLGILAPEHQIKYITFWFEGDPLIDNKQKKRMLQNPEFKIVKPKLGADGIWRFEFDIQLEQG